MFDDRPHQEFAASNLRILRDLAATAIELLEARSRQIELARCSRELAHLAGHDPLTGLPNRRLFHNRVEDAAAARAPGDEVAMLYLDLDGFKAVNDTLGHDAGDTLLREVADRLRASVRDGDVVARLGGDEFAIVLRTGRLAAQQAADFAARLIRIVSCALHGRGASGFGRRQHRRRPRREHARAGRPVAGCRRRALRGEIRRTGHLPDP